MNLVILAGALSRAPEQRTLPSGDVLASFEVTVRPPDGPAESVPVVWFDPPDRALALAAGRAVVVSGRVRRRFFRTAAGTGSRTEVVATLVVPASRRATVRAVAAQGAAALEQLAGG